MPKRNDILLITDIITAMDEITEFIKGFTFDSFIEDTKTKAAVVRNFKVIGEALKLISEEITTTFKLAEWKAADARLFAIN